MKTIALILMAALITGCGSQKTEPKELASSWKSQDQLTVLDLTTVEIGSTQNISVEFPEGKCACRLTLTGSRAAGTHTLAMCSLVVGVADCASLNGSGTYQLTTHLELCSQGACEKFY